MKAAILGDAGLTIGEADKPRPLPNEILVRVRACGLNRADLIMLAGHKHGAAGGPGTVLGLEWAGDVVEVGSEVTRFRPGDRVMGSGRGAFAEYAVTDWGRALHLPSPGMSYEQAAILPVALQTMHDAIVTHGRLKSGESILIQGASSGVGLMGLQIARLMGARLIIGTSTTEWRQARLKEFGADLALDSRQEDWPDRVQAATGNQGVDVIIDQISGVVANQNMKAAALLARIVNVGRLGGMRGEFDFDLHALKRIDYIGVTFRTRTVEEVREINARMVDDLWDALKEGRLHLPIDKAFPFDQAAEALAHMKANAHFGKIVLSL